GWVQVTVEGQYLAAVAQGVLDDDYALVPVPAFRLGVCDQSVADAVDRFAKGGAAPRAPPIFPGMELAIAVAENAEIMAAGDVVGVGRVHGEVEDVHHAAGGIGLGRGRLPLCGWILANDL